MRSSTNSAGLPFDVSQLALPLQHSVKSHPSHYGRASRLVGTVFQVGGECSIYASAAPCGRNKGGTSQPESGISWRSHPDLRPCQCEPSAPQIHEILFSQLAAMPCLAKEQLSSNSAFWNGATSIQSSRCLPKKLLPIREKSTRRLPPQAR